MDIKDNKKENIMRTFNKFMEIASDINEFDKRVNIIKDTDKEDNFKEYVNALMFLSEFQDMFPKDKDYEDVIYDYMVKIKNGLENNLGKIYISLFSGLADFAYCINNVNKNLGHYDKFLNTLNNFIADKVEFLIKNTESINYDTIGGLAGCGSYLLNFKEDKKILKAIESIIKYFTKMSRDIEVNNHMVPAWYQPKESLFLDQDKERFPNGNFNISLSHGISGPLVFLSLALKQGIEVEHQKDVMKKMIRDVKRFHKKDEQGMYSWGGMIKFEDYINENSDFEALDRQSWCYGPIGYSRSLYIAGDALNDKELMDFSNDVMESIAESDHRNWKLNTSILCHGYSGVLAIMEAMYKDTKNPKYKKCMDKLVDVILNTFDEKSLFGFYNYTMEYKKRLSFGEDVEMDYRDEYSFLEGSSGIVLCLMNYLYPERNSWMRHLLID